MLSLLKWFREAPGGGGPRGHPSPFFSASSLPNSCFDECLYFCLDSGAAVHSHSDPGVIGQCFAVWAAALSLASSAWFA